MHIPDGILPPAVCLAGYVATGAATYYALRKIEQQSDPRAEVAKASLLTAAFFVASWIHIPIPPTSVHLTLIGLMGAVLGYYAFPAILIGLFFQAVMFQHGGLTTLGVNAIVMGLPALLSYQVLALWHKLLGARLNRTWLGVLASLSGALALLLAALLATSLLIATIPAELDVAAERSAILSMGLAHIPLSLIEGLITALVVLFLQRVRPEALAEGIGPTAEKV